MRRMTARMFKASVAAAVGFVCGLGPAGEAHAQPHIESKVDIAFNRYYSYEDIIRLTRELAAAYPELVELRVLGESIEGRELLVAIVTGPEGGAHDEKPAMWIDGNIHGNEIQAAEVVLYTLWYLTKSYGANAKLTRILDDNAFYLMPMVNPDGRAYWFTQPATPHSARQNLRPKDSDLDGTVNSDGLDDLDGDGSITMMWKKDPDGDWIRDRHDPRIFRRVEPGQKGDYIYLGWEGTDLDGDGRINEDPPFGDDMNRAFPGDWQPEYVQRGAGDIPLQTPESLETARFILDHPNIAAVQSYHNTGGMILRGPGTDYRENLYSRSDLRVYDRLAEPGVEMLPFYRYLIIYKDLYNVHGGFVTWTAETLGVISFTNELWTVQKFFQREGRMDDERTWLWRDKLAFGELFTEYTEVDHPQYGQILVGGPNKWSSRVTPTFMLEEECHRNFAFTVWHAENMPKLSFGRREVRDLGPSDFGRLWSVTVAIENEKIIPTRTDLAVRKSIGRSDILTCEPSEGEVVAAGRVGSWFDKHMDPVRAEPGRVQVAEGIPGQGRRLMRFVVAAPEGAEVTLRYDAEKARTIEERVELTERLRD